MTKTYIIAIFFACSLALAGKDLGIKLLFHRGETFPEIIFFVGIFSLIASLVLSTLKRHAIKLNNPMFQVGRLAIVAVSSSLIFLSIKLLPPTVLNVGSKMTLPLMIVGATILGLNYTVRERWLAGLTLCVMTLFLAIAVARQDASFIGVIVLTACVVSVIFEFICLNRTVHTESGLYVSTVPSIALMIVGVIVGVIEGNVFTIPNFATLFILFVCGILYFMAYYSGVIRYKLLPPGLAEYPSLATVLIVWPFDILFFDGKTSIASLAVALVGIIMIGYIITIHKRYSTIK